ncbi:hypothetical protein GJ496_008157 [Pomphorhynchus laevis]|nr:hypothetical protein GJ496_008157 [Pomphorhynchus laevis]
MSVVGFDVGNYGSYIGIARSGGLEVLTNEYSERQNPSFISINGRERSVGQSAKQQEISHFKNTFKNFKRLIGRNFSDPLVQKELEYLPFEVFSDKSDSIFIKANYDGTESYFTPQQLYAMVLSKLIAITQANTGVKPVDCVISTPLYSTDLERRAIKEAAQIAGLNCMRLMNDSAAVALNYGMYKLDLPEESSSPVNVVFVDMGYTSLQVSAVAFHKSKCRTLGVSFDSCLGSRNFDYVIAEYCIKDIKKRFSIDIQRKCRAGIRLLNQCEKAKKMMSTIATPVPIDVECLIDGEDYHYTIGRETFDKMSADILSRIRAVLEDVLTNSGLTVSDISSVEIVGGGTRVTAVKQLVRDVFNKEPSTTLNADEAVSRGCTLMCAILSPSFRVRQIQISDIQPFPITISWKSQENDDTSKEVFNSKDNFPLTKMIRVNKPIRNTLEVEARYTYPNNIPFGEPRIGFFIIEGIKPEYKDLTKLRFRARINSDGIFEMKQAQVYEQSENAPNEENQQSASSEQQSTDERRPNPEADEAAPTQDGQGPVNIPIEKNADRKSSDKAPKKVAKVAQATSVDLTVSTNVRQLTRDQLIRLQEIEVDMLDVDRREKEKADSRNAIEEYIYDTRDKITSTYKEYATSEHVKCILQGLDAQEDWLLNTADSKTDKSEFERRLNSLRKLSDPVAKRYREHNERPKALKNFDIALHDVINTYNLWYSGDAALSHLTKEDMTKVHNSVQQQKQFIDNVYESVKSLPLHSDSKYSVQDIENAKNELQRICLPIIKKAKPAPPAPKPPATPQPSAATNENANPQSGCSPATDSESSAEADSHQSSDAYGKDVEMNDQISNNPSVDDTPDVE